MTLSGGDRRGLTSMIATFEHIICNRYNFFVWFFLLFGIIENVSSSFVWTPQRGNNCRSAVGRPQKTGAVTTFSSLQLSSSSSGNNNNNNNKRRTASQQERLNEERRRLERKNDVVIGKTSAISGAKDFQLNIRKTEMEWEQQATPIERQIRVFTQQGMDALHMLKLDEAKQAFDLVYELKPNAYCWHAGVVEFYLGKYQAAARRLQQNALLFEAKFGEPASEERIWFYATLLKYNQLKKKSAEPLICDLPMEDIPLERRKVLRMARDLFESSVNNDAAGVAMARARLRATADMGDPKKLDYKLWKLSSWYYLGLHYDAIGDNEEAKECMKKAIQQCSPASMDIIHTLPLLHMTVRDWFDDDEYFEDDVDKDIMFEESIGFDDKSNTILNMDSATGETDSTALSDNANTVGTSNQYSMTKAGRTQAALQSRPRTMNKGIIIESVQTSVTEMKITQLKDALKKRGLKFSGSKTVLQQRLLQSMMDDINQM